MLHTCSVSLVLNVCFGKFGINLNLFDEFILNESKEINSKILTLFMFGSLTFYVQCFNVFGFFFRYLSSMVEKLQQNYFGVECWFRVLCVCVFWFMSMDEIIWQPYFVESVGLVCLFCWFIFMSSTVKRLQQPYFVENVGKVNEDVASTIPMLRSYIHHF